MGSCLPLSVLLQAVSLGPFLARGNAELQTPSPLLSGGAGDLLLQVLQHSLLEDHPLEPEPGADPVPSQEPGERQEELLLSWGWTRELHLPKAV